MSHNHFGHDVITYRQRFTVSFNYPVHFCECMFDVENRLLVDTLTSVRADRPQRFVVVVDQAVAESWPRLMHDIASYASHYHVQLSMVASPLVVPGGEAVKNDFSHLQRVVEFLQQYHIDRHSYVLAIGGGAVLDMVGLAAASVHRGVRLVRVPTTVLAQNDAGIGVKNGINAFGSKNFIGSFAPPFAVFNDFQFLSTLSARDRIAGLAEAVKVALIRDVDFFNWLEKHADALQAFEPKATAYMIRRCAELHLEHIAGNGDPFEGGSARPLDFGHWAAHRIEALTVNAVRHGEAVAMGMVLDNRYAVTQGMLDELTEHRVKNLLLNLGLPVFHPLFASHEGRQLLSQGLDEFQEHLGGELSVTMLSRVGCCIEVHAIDRDDMYCAMAQLGGEQTREMSCVSMTAT